LSRTIAAILGLVLGANALAMLAAPLWWYGAVPGVTTTGPFNEHFIHDIGMTYLVVAGGLGWFAWRSVQGWPALVSGAAFLVLHGLIHVHDAIASPTCGQDLVRDLPGVFAPAVIAAWIAVASAPGLSTRNPSTSRPRRT
jgi:hypothetical protein